MDFSLREWLLIIGVLIIIGVVLDGLRRARRGRNDSLKLAIDKNFKFNDGARIDYYNGELPSGGARVVRRSPETAEGAKDEVHDSGHPDALIDISESGVDNDPVPSPDEELRPDPLFVDDQQPQAMTTELDEPAGDQQVQTQAEQTEAVPREVEEVIVINAFAAEGAEYKGAELVGVILACGMRYGEMSIFHRNEGDKGEGAVQFSMANVVKPGVFDLDRMAEFSTPGVSFFMSLPGPQNSLMAFDYMLETAQCVAKNLGGELRDEQHSTMTAQTIEHARQKIRDYERRQLSLLK